MLPSTPQATATPKCISPLAARYPAGGMTSSLGRGRTEDSIAISITIPGYPRSRKRSSSQCIQLSSIEAVLSDQGDEAGSAERRLQDSGVRPLEQREGLGAAAGAQGDQQAPARRELLEERRRDVRAACGHQNRVVRRVGAPAQGAVAEQYRDVGDARLAERLLGGAGELPHPLHAEHRGRERSQQRRLIARSGPDLEHPLLAGEPQRLEVARLRQRLGDRLAAPNRQRRVLVGTVA